jgi:hypothetical protein
LGSRGAGLALRCRIFLQRDAIVALIDDALELTSGKG